MSSLALDVLARGTAGLTTPAIGAQPAQPGPLYVLPGNWHGLKAAGTIDLNDRPVVDNPDGSYSTVKSISFGFPGGEVLVPQVVGGKVVGPRQAWETFQRTGQHLGIFTSAAAATAYADALHREQAQRYSR